MKIRRQMLILLSCLLIPCLAGCSGAGGAASGTDISASVPTETKDASSAAGNSQASSSGTAAGSSLASSDPSAAGSSHASEASSTPEGSSQAAEPTAAADPGPSTAAEPGPGTAADPSPATAASPAESTVPVTPDASGSKVPPDSTWKDPKEPSSGGEALLSPEEVIALVTARVPGSTADSVFSLELDHEDGRWQYEGELFFNGLSYEFEIDAQNGNILDWEIDD